MHVLALDTTTRDGSVALVTEGGVIAERRGDDRRTHAERMPGELMDLLEACALSINDVDLFAVASGPGSFTGLRIGIATIQGLALATGHQVVAVSALEALAQSADVSLDKAAGAERPSGTLIAPWMDAHRDEVFAALYRWPGSRGGELEPLEGPTVGAPAAVLARWVAQFAGEPLVFIGDGTTRHRAIIDAQARGSRILETPLLAGMIGRLALRRAREGNTIHPAAIQPVYVRRPDAELAKERSALSKR